jgi:hypothetical protein
MSNLQAIPTEYGGIIYRSKCEAMFAKWLTMTGFPSGDLEFIRFDYEPASFCIDGWIPDFVVIRLLPAIPIDRLHFSVIEYKPCAPTNAYVNQFAARCLKLQETIFCANADVDYVIYYGSVYGESRGHILIDFDGNQPLVDYVNLDWLEGFEDCLRDTRFDLQSGE